MPSIVVVPATPLLVRGAAGAADPLADVRKTVREVLRRELDGGGSVAVLGTGPTARAGRLRPTLGAAGVADAQVPALRAWGAADDVAWDGFAATGASVALLALADAGVDLAKQPVDVVEVPGEAPGAVVTSAVERLRARLGAASSDLLVVADHPAPGVDAVVEALTATEAWVEEQIVLPQEHEHLPPVYRVAVRRRRTVTP